jgi:aspartate ammonia-lyase
MNNRIEHDFIGDRELPENVYYGVQTLRARENFHITGLAICTQPLFIQSFAFVKKAAAMANRDCGVLEPRLAEAILHACDEIIGGKYHEHFVSDLIQGGAGTSVNMNVNEVISNIGLEYLGFRKGEYKHLHPNNHVNCSQSTNDTYPTAISLTLYRKTDLLINAFENLSRAFVKKASDFSNVLKMGRTQLQDAVPMMMGQEFNGFATAIGNNIRNLRHAQMDFLECNMGGTAIGTQVNAPQNYPGLVTSYLATLTGLPVSLSDDLINASSDTGPYVHLSGILKKSAIALSKICNDLRLLASGPRAGLFEINLPKMQPGSSIMPGKVNPVIPEVVNQTAFYVIGADLTVTMAAEAGQLELNVMEPVIAFSLFNSLDYLTNAVVTLTEKCVNGITANEKLCYNDVMKSVGIVTLLNPVLGYETASEIAREALATNKLVHDIAVTERRLISQEHWDQIYTVENMVHPGT